MKGMQVSKQSKKKVISDSPSLQDWKEKYIHPNYTRIFTENFTEEVCIHVQFLLFLLQFFRLKSQLSTVVTVFSTRIFVFEISPLQ